MDLLQNKMFAKTWNKQKVVSFNEMKTFSPFSLWNFCQKVTENLKEKCSLAAANRQGKQAAAFNEQLMKQSKKESKESNK